MASIVALMYGQLDLKLDLLKALKLILLHDIPEVYADDVWIKDSNDRQALN